MEWGPADDIDKSHCLQCLCRHVAHTLCGHGCHSSKAPLQNAADLRRSSQPRMSGCACLPAAAHLVYVVEHCACCWPRPGSHAHADQAGAHPRQLHQWRYGYTHHSGRLSLRISGVKRHLKVCLTHHIACCTRELLQPSVILLGAVTASARIVVTAGAHTPGDEPVCACVYGGAAALPAAGGHAPAAASPGAAGSMRVAANDTC